MCELVPVLALCCIKGVRCAVAWPFTDVCEDGIFTLYEVILLSPLGASRFMQGQVCIAVQTMPSFRAVKTALMSFVWVTVSLSAILR